MPPRTLFAWFILFLIVAAAMFFSYHIMYASQSDGTVNSYSIQSTNHIVAKNAYAEDSVLHTDVGHASLSHPTAVQEMPQVVGQTEEDLRSLRQVSETPPSVEYMEPEAKDPMEQVANSEAEFGDNLRHPEQMIEMHPPMGTMRIAASGLGSDEMPSMGGHQSVQYEQELAQNGAEFMSGIFAFDGSDMGIGYSMI